MARWMLTNPTTDEAPFAWNALHERFRIGRGISINQTAAGPHYETGRYYSYTDELATINSGLNFFRGGYEHVVDDATKADLIASGVVTSANFTLSEGFGAFGFGSGPFGG